MTDLRSGFTTGSCAAAAAKAAAMALCGQTDIKTVDIALPDGSLAEMSILQAKTNEQVGTASVRKDAGDDPDVTDKVVVEVTVKFNDSGDIVFKAGSGVGTVTKPGLQIPVGQPAINPVPREMITQALRSVTDKGAVVTVSIEGGEEIAKKTFNPRLGIVGGLSVIGTSGKVRPFSCPALRSALKCSLDVAAASNVTAPVLVPGHIGEKAARKNFALTDEQVIEVSNEWGFILESLSEYAFEELLVLGHPGKLGKLANRCWDTHSSRSDSPAKLIKNMAKELLDIELADSATIEGLFADMQEDNRQGLSNALSEKVRQAVAEKTGKDEEKIAVVLVNMTGDILGSSGDTDLWKK